MARLGVGDSGFDEDSDTGSSTDDEEDARQRRDNPLSGGTETDTSTPDDGPTDTGDSGGTDSSTDDRQRGGSDPFGGGTDPTDSGGDDSSTGNDTDNGISDPTPPPSPPTSPDPPESGGDDGSDDNRPRPPKPPTTPTPDNGDDTTQQNDTQTGDDTTQQKDTQTIEPEQPGPTPTDQGVEKFGHDDQFIFDGKKYGENELTDQIESRLASQNENVDPSDIEAELENQVARLYLTDEGANKFKGEAGKELQSFTVPTTRSAAKSVENRVVAQTELDPEDVSILETASGDYEVQLTETELAEQAAEQIANRDNVDPESVSIKDGKVVVERSGIEPKRRPDTQETTVADRINPAANKLQAAKKQQGSRVGERPTRPGGIRTFEEFFKREVAKEASEETGLNVKPGDIQLDRTDDGIEASIQERERFGDIDWSFGMGGRDDEVERRVDRAGDRVSRAGRNLADELFKPSGVAGQSIGEEVLRAAGREDLARAYEENLRRFGKGLVGGTTAIANVPGMVGGVMEGVEYANYATEETIEGRGDETLSESYDRAIAVGQQMAKQPYQSAGLLAGSLAASTAVMSTAAKVSRRAGLASRLAIQPGEEAAGYGGHLLTRTISSKRTADRLFPQKEPLIFSEEAAIRTAKAASQKAKSGTRTLKGETKLAETGPTPYRAELYGRFEPGTATETTAEQGMPGARSEPLGSETERILDATVGSPRQYEVTTETAETETTTGSKQGVTPEMEAMASKAQGRSELAQAIDEFGVDVREFAASERGQASLTGVGRTETETKPEIEDDRVSDNLYQQAVEQQVKAEYSVRGKGTYEGVSRPFETETETETEGPQRRVERAQEPEVNVESDIIRRYETALEMGQEPTVSTDVDTLARARPDARTELQQRPGQDSELVNRIDNELEPLSRADIDTEAETETVSETDLEFETELDYETEFDNEFRRELELNVENEFETETETEPEPEPRPEVEGDPDQSFVETEQFGGGTDGFETRGRTKADEGLGAGYYSELVTGLALGAGPREAPSEKELESLGGAVELTEQRPTKAMLSGTKKEQEQIEAAEAFLSFGAGESEGEGLDDGSWGLL